MHKEEEVYSPHGSDPLQAAANVCKSLGSQTGFPLFDRLPNVAGQRRQTTTPDFMGALRDATESLGAPSLAENSRIDSGWTYFGQFIAHDLTVRRELNDTKPRLNLECLYGFGPKSSGYLYEVYKDPHYEYTFRAVRFVFDPYINTTGDKVDDVFRTGAGRNVPVMADVRNDDNFLLNQLHCAFMRFHNRIAEFFHEKYKEQQVELFNRTRHFVTWTYQWLIVNEYLQLLTGDVADGLITKGHPYKILARIDKPKRASAIIPEFILATLRIGHSQVRSSYALNRHSGHLPLYMPEALDLRGFVRDCRRGPVDWRFFFTMDERQKPQKSRPMDLMIAPPLRSLPFLPKDNRDLAKINIDRSINHDMVIWDADLEVLRKTLRIDTLVTFKAGLEILHPNDGVEDWKNTLLKLDGLPLWVFILLEARIKGTDTMQSNTSICQQLGPLGAQIIAEQLVWILKKDADSYVCTDPTWQPMQELSGNYTPISKVASPCLDKPALFSIADVLYIAEHGLYFSPSK